MRPLEGWRKGVKGCRKEGVGWDGGVGIHRRSKEEEGKGRR